MVKRNSRVNAVVAALLGAVLASAGIASEPDPYLKPRFRTGERYADIYSKSVSIVGQGFEPIVKRFGGSSAYTVTDPNPDAPRFDESDIVDGRPPVPGTLVIRDQGNTNCYNDACYLNSQTSGLAFIPLLWGVPPGPLKAGLTWKISIDKPWEIGPAGTEKVQVISVDPVEKTLILQREGFGTGPAEDDKRGLPISVNGKSGTANVVAGLSHWSGRMIVRAGIVLSDEILIERVVTLHSDLGDFTGVERVYTISASMPVVNGGTD